VSVWCQQLSRVESVWSAFIYTHKHPSLGVCVPVGVSLRPKWLCCCCWGLPGGPHTCWHLKATVGIIVRHGAWMASQPSHRTPLQSPISHTSAIVCCANTNCFTASCVLARSDKSAQAPPLSLPPSFCLDASLCVSPVCVCVPLYRTPGR